LRQSLKVTITRRSTGVTNFDILYPEAGPVPNGQQLHVQRASAEDADSAYTRIRFGRSSPAETVFHADEDSPTAGEIVDDPELTVLDAGERYCCRFVGTTAGDTLRLTLQGFIKEV